MHFTQGNFAFGLNWFGGSVEEDSIFSLYVTIISPYKGGVTSFLNKNSLKFHMDVLCQIRLKLKLSIFFENFTIISPLKGFGPLFEQIVIPFP